MSEIINRGAPLPRIVSAAPLEARHVLVVWRGGGRDVIDVMPALMKKKIFFRLRHDDELFRTLMVNEDGNAVEWADGAELSAVWMERLAATDISNEQFRTAMEELGFTPEGIAVRLGVSRRRVDEYRRDKEIPRSISLAVRYLLDQRKAG